MRLLKISNYKKGFLLSLALHSILLFAVAYESSTPTKSTPQQSNKISISLSSFAPQKEMQKPQVAPAPPKANREKIVKNEKPKEQKKHTAPKKPQLAKKQVEVKKTPIEPQKIQKEEQIQEQEQELVQSEPIQKEPLKETQESTQKVADATPTPELPKESQEPSAASLQEEFIAANFEVIRSMVLENLKYPHLAKRMRQTGIVELLLVINEQGKLIDISLEHSSGYKLLDKSALKAAEYLAEMTLPAPKNTSRILLPVAFALN